MSPMKIFVPVAGVVLVAAAFRAYGWAGVAVVTGGIVMWVLLHYTRLVNVLRRAADRSPALASGRIDISAPGLGTLCSSKALGALQSPKDEQPEVFRWTDAGESHVTCTFTNGRLTQWALHRPSVADEPPASAPAAPPADPPAP